MPYRITYSPEAQDHIRGLTANQRALVAEAISKHLRHQPTVETRNRKHMQANPLADWELRVRNLRIYYVVQEEDDPFVRIEAVGVKVREDVYLGGRRWISHGEDGRDPHVEDA